MPVEEVLGFELWRFPDESDVDSAIWYGAEGPEGDVATAVSKTGPYQYEVAEVQDVRGLIEEPEENFLVTSVSIDLDNVVQEAWRISGDEARKRLDGLDDEVRLRMVVGLGAGYISERGGDQTWAATLAEGIAEII